MEERTGGTRVAPQVLILLLAPLLWLLLGEPALWALAAAYLAAWLLLELGLPKGRTLTLPLGRGTALTLAAVLLAAPLAALVRDRYQLLETEEWDGLPTHLADRARLETLPAIAPGVAFCDHPQTFYAHAPGASRVGLRMGAIELPGGDLGHGLFRLDYDPRRDGPPPGEGAEIEVTLAVDGREVPRRLRVVCPEAHPRSLRSAPERGLAAAVSEETDELFMLSRRGLEHRIAVADGPTDAVFFDRGRRLAVGHRYDPDLLVLDTESGAELGRWRVGRYQRRLAVAPGGALLAVAVGGLAPHVRFLELPGGRALESLALPFIPTELAFGPGDDRLVLAADADPALHLAERGASGWRLGARLELGRPAVTLGRSHDGRRWLVAVTDYRPSGEAHRANHFIQDQLLAVDAESFRVVERWLTGRRSEVQDRPGDLDQGLSPMGIAAKEDGGWRVAFAGSEEVWKLDGRTIEPLQVVAGLDLDLVATHGVAELGEGYWVASSPAGGALAIFDAAGEMVEFVGVAPPDAELDAAPPGSRKRHNLRLRAGERAFYEATRSGISCQSCHRHAATDHSRHDIGQRPLLPTLPLGGLAGTAPYLRDGSFPRVRDLDAHLADRLYRGYRRRLPGRGEALEAFVESLPVPVNPRRFGPRDLERERAGADAFVDAGCVRCHSFPAFSHLGQHPTLSLFPEYGAEQPPGSRLDTPSLLGLHARSHLLQDGRADDVEAVLTTHNRSDRHGRASILDAGERAALAHFLESL